MANATEHTSTVGQEIDAMIAQHVFQHEIIRQKRGGIREKTLLGQIRPLRAYSREMNAAWEVAHKMKVTLIPIETGDWFALVGKPEGWTSPAELMQYMNESCFVEGGAAVQESAPLAICLAALTAVEKRRTKVHQTAAVDEARKEPVSLRLAPTPEAN